MFNKISILLLSVLLNQLGYCNSINLEKSSSLEMQSLKNISLKDSAKHQKYIEQLFNQKAAATQKGNVKSADGAVLFVSFSMPTSLIIDLSEQAHQFHIPMVIRGLVNNDFKETLKKLVEIKNEAHKSKREFYGLAIDPIWFEQFHIKKVPALVVTKRDSKCELQKICSNQPFQAIYGNSSVKDSLRTISENKSAVSGIAAKLLQGANNA